MKKLLFKVILGLAAISAGSAFAGIQNSKHDLGAGSTGGNQLVGGTGEICVFCHTPHGSDTSAAVPLWNRALPDPATYTTYDTLGTSSLDGGVAEMGSVSLACLSCHDGSQAMNTVINQPGTDGYNAAGAPMTGTLTKANPTGIALIGTDLTNDHPVGIQYAGGGVTSVTCAAAGTCSAALADGDFNQPEHAVVNGKDIWWVDTGGAGRAKTDLQLYTRNETVNWNGDALASAGIQPFVECASCHDPHNTDNGTFLRISNDNSAVCTACHTK